MCLCAQISFLYPDNSHIGLGPTLDSNDFILPYLLLKDPISKYGCILKKWKLGL